MSKPKEPDLFAWAPENPGKVLRPGAPIFSPETAVSETQKAVADKAVAAVTTVRPVSIPRPVVESPLADASDGVVQFLEHLADAYDGESKIVDAQLARAITVHKDYIVIGGHKLSRNNELIWEWDEEFMTFERAQRWFEDLPTEEQWTEIIDSIPGEKVLEKIENILTLLFGPYHGFERDESKEIYPLIHFWVQKKSIVTSTKKKDKRGKPLAHRLTIGQYSKWDRDPPHRFIQTGWNKEFCCFTRRLLW